MRIAIPFPYDMMDVEFTHQRDDCTFETLLKCFALADPTVRSLGEMIQDSDLKPVWRILFFRNINLAIVVAISFGLQVWSHHNATLGRFLKTSSMSLADCFLLLAVGAIPLVALESGATCPTAKQD